MRSPIICKRIHTTTISIKPTHIALLQIPVEHVESACPAGVQNVTRTAAAEISAGKTTIEIRYFLLSGDKQE